MMKCALCQTNSLEGYANAAFIQQPDGDLVPLTHPPKHCPSLHHAVCERHLAGAACANSKFVLVAPNVQTRVAGVDDECGDSFVPETQGAIG